MYDESSRTVFCKDTNYFANAGIRNKRIGQNYHPSNNKIERLNGEIHDREKIFRGLKKMDTLVLDDMSMYSNFTKKHRSLYDKIPAEHALIKVDGKNKWKTLIQNTNLNKTTNYFFLNLGKNSN